MSDHNGCRSKVCVVCIRKATRNRSLSTKDIELVKRFARNHYDISDPDYPSGLCNGCYLLLRKKEKDDSVSLNVEAFTPDRQLQLRSSVCDCVVCQVAKSGLFMAKRLKKKAGRPSKEVAASATSTSSSAILSISPSKRPPPSLTTPLATSIRICRICFTELYQGCRHKCSGKTSRKRKIENLDNLVSSPKTSSMLAERVARRDTTQNPKRNLFGISC